MRLFLAVSISASTITKYAGSIGRIVVYYNHAQQDRKAKQPINQSRQVISFVIGGQNYEGTDSESKTCSLYEKKGI